MQRKKLIKWLFPEIRSTQPAENTSLLGESDLFAQLEAKEGSTLFLGKFSTQQIHAALERSSILAALQARGFDECFLCIESIDEFNQALRLYDGTPDPEHLLAEIRLREVLFTPARLYPQCDIDTDFSMLSIDWLMMQNPRAEFTPEHPPLPGQQYPGLGLGRKVLRMLLAYCRWQGLAGLINYPEYFHNAYIYRETFSFFNPERSGMFLALVRDLGHLSLAEMTWAIECGCVYHREKEQTYEWTSNVQIMPLNSLLQSWPESDSYKTVERESCESHHFEFDEKRFREKCATGDIPHLH